MGSTSTARHRGARATVFTRVIRRGGRTYIQYWLYYPDSNSAIAGSDKAWEYRHLVPVVGGVLRALGDYPGYHRDDWESYFVRIDPDGQAWVRASSHGHWQGCKLASCRNSWTAQTGWTRVSRGSHAGHIPLRSEPTGGGGPVTPMPSRFAGERRLRWRHFPQLPGVHIHERTTTAEGLRLIPLETRDHAGYRPLDEDIRPPWQKDAYDDPESHES